MPLLAVGLNHKTAPLQIRERVVFAHEHLTEVLQELVSFPQVSEAAILSTCNRTELLCTIDDPENTTLLIDWLSSYHNFPSAEISSFIYSYPDQFAVQHLLRVASGLDSMILGEPQILGQIKDAYLSAKEAGTVGRLLSKLFEHAFSVAKQVRTDTAIGANPVSVAFAAVSLAKQIFSSITDHTALLIGAGDTIELAARHLQENGIKRMIIANRSLSKAQALVSETNGIAINLREIPDHLPQADIVISSTASQLPILGKGAVERAIKVRKHQPILMVDIAVPRDIEPEVGDLNDVYLYTVDDLKEIIDESFKSRQEAAHQAEQIIDVQVTHFMGWVKSLESIPTIRNYREQIKQIRETEIAKARRLLTQGADPEVVVQQLARALCNKIIHSPTVQMRKASYEGREDLIKAAHELLDIKKRNP